MPSLKVNRTITINRENLNAFQHFYQSFAKKPVKQSRYLASISEEISPQDNYNNTSNSKSLFASFIACVLLTIWVNIVTFTCNVTVWDFIYYNYENFYSTHKLHRGRVIAVIICDFISSILLVFTFFNQYARNSLIKIICLAFFINVAQNGTILLLLNINYHDSKNTIILHFICNSKFGHDIMCSECKQDYSLYMLYYWCLYQPVSLLMTILINHKWGNSNHSTMLDDSLNTEDIDDDNENDDKNDKSVYQRLSVTSELESSIGTCTTNCNARDIDDGAPLSVNAIVTEYVNIPALAVNKISCNNVVVPLVRFSKHERDGATITFIRFLILWMTFIWCIYVLLTLNISELSYVFYWLLGISSVFKWVLKRVARQIDMYTMRLAGRLGITYATDVNVSKFYHFVSLEILVELVITMIYYAYYYFYFILHLSLINNSNVFIKITICNTLSEMFHSTLRLSKPYFYLTSKIQNAFVNWQVCKRCVPFWLVKITKDDSTFSEWQTRYAIDMSFRVFSIVINFAMVMIWLYIVGYKEFNIGNENSFENGIFYFVIAFGIEVTYFFFVFCINYVCYHFNVWKPFLTVFEANFRVSVSLFTVAALLITVVLL